VSLLSHFSVRVGVPALLVVAGVAACASNDGRQLPVAREDQNQSILTTTTTTLTPEELAAADTEPPAAVVSESTLVVGSDAVTTTTAAVVPTLAPFSVQLPWAPDAAIPARYTCTGTDERDVAPIVQWTGAPAETVELAVVMTDGSAGGFVHWIVTGIAPTVTGLPEAALPEGASMSLNSAGSATYLGPCPPAGIAHTYLIEVIALGQQYEAIGTTPAEVVDALRAASIYTTSQAGVFSGA
jgi:Raf kinase inhibitor-like YbhB/YbcL family protein